MDSREIALWMDSRWCNALESATGKTMDALMREQVDTLIQTLPQDVQDRINEEIRQEDKQWAEEKERTRRFSVSRVTECGETRIYEVAVGEADYHAAGRLRRYLRGENQGKPLYPDGHPLTEAEMERHVAEAVRSSQRVVGVYDIDLDAGEFSILDVKKGWQTYRVKDISTAVYFASKKESAEWITKRDNFRERLKGLETLPVQRPVFIRGAEPLPMDKVCFENEVVQNDNCLNFYMPVYFDPDIVLGTHVGTDENNDWINLYANYDMERGCVCDTLEVYLVRGDGSELDCQYRLTPEECAALLPKMDAYCKEQMGLSLEEAGAQYLSEGPGDTPQVEAQQISPQQPGPMMQM